MQDLARLRVLRHDRGGRLGLGEKGEHAARDVGRQPEQFERGQDAVAAKRCAEPGNAGIGICAGGRIGDEHPKIGQRSADPLIERRIGADHARCVAEGGSRSRLRHRIIERDDRRVPILHVAFNRQIEVAALVRFERKQEHPRAVGKAIGTARWLDMRGPLDAIESAIAKQRRRVGGGIGQPFAASSPTGAAHFEHVGEVRIESEGDVAPESGAARGSTRGCARAQLPFQSTRERNRWSVPRWSATLP